MSAASISCFYHRSTYMNLICLPGIGCVPFDDLMSCSLDSVGKESEATTNGWMGVHDPVCPINPYLQGFAAVKSGRPIRDGNHGGIRQPRLGGKDGLED